MLSSVINSPKAIQVNIAIMRAFIKLRKLLSTHKILADKLSLLEKRMDEKDKEVRLIFEAIRQIMHKPEESPKPGIGFHVR